MATGEEEDGRLVGSGRQGDRIDLSQFLASMHHRHHGRCGEGGQQLQEIPPAEQLLPHGTDPKHAAIARQHAGCQHVVQDGLRFALVGGTKGTGKTGLHGVFGQSAVLEDHGHDLLGMEM